MNPSWKTFESGADEEGFFDPAQELFGRAKTLFYKIFIIFKSTLFI